MKLLPNTKLTKDIIQQILSGDAASDFTEVVQGLADVHSEEIIANAIDGSLLCAN